MNLDFSQLLFTVVAVKQNMQKRPKSSRKKALLEKNCSKQQSRQIIRKNTYWTDGRRGVEVVFFVLVCLR